MEHKIEENLIHDIQNPEKKVSGIGFEMSREQANQITTEFFKINEAILHDKPIHIEDLEDLSKVAKGTKIDIGGEIMTVEEAENIPDLKMNIEIWKEMKEGNFDNISKLTRITPSVSKYLENFKGDFWFNNLTSAKGLILPATVKRILSLNGLTSAEGLILPTIVEGFLSLSGLISAEGLTLPTTIGGGLSLDGLTSAKNLILPTTVKGFLSLSGLTSAEGLTLPTTIGGGISLNGLTSAEGLILPNNVKGDFYLNGLTSTEGLTLPTTIGGVLSLNGLTSAEGLTLPTTINRKLYLRSLTSADKEELKKKYPQYTSKIY